MGKSTGWHVAIVVLLVILLLILLTPGKKQPKGGVGCGCCDKCQCKSYMPISKEPYCGAAVQESYY